MQEMWVPSLGLEDHLVKEMLTTPVFFPGESYGQRVTSRYDLETKWQQVDKNTIFCWVAYEGLSAQVSSLTYLCTCHILVTQYLQLFLYTTSRVPVLLRIACTCSHTSAMLPFTERRQHCWILFIPPTMAYIQFRVMILLKLSSGLPGLAGKESSCNAGDPSLIPELGRFPGESTGYSLK